MNKDSDVLTVDEVAEKLRIHRVTVVKLLTDGTLKGFKIGSSWRIKKESLNKFMDGEK